MRVVALFGACIEVVIALVGGQLLTEGRGSESLKMIVSRVPRFDAFLGAMKYVTMNIKSLKLGD